MVRDRRSYLLLHGEDTKHRSVQRAAARLSYSVLLYSVKEGTQDTTQAKPGLSGRDLLASQ